MPNGEFGQTLKDWIATLEGIEGAILPEEKGQLQSDAYALYLRYLELIARTYPELTDYEKQNLALRQAEQAWDKRRFGLEQQQELGIEQARLGWQQQEAMLPWTQGMTPYEQARMGLQERQWQAGLMARPSDWIQRWYAMQSGQYPEAPKPWYTKGSGLAGIAGWESMKPEERGEWIERFQHSQWARLDPTIQEQVKAGYGFPTPQAGEQISYGQPYQQPEVDVKPSGEIKIRLAGAPMTGRAAQQAPQPPQPVERYTAGKGIGKISPMLVGPPPPRGGGIRERQPSAPPTPAWLAQFAPWLTVGEPIKPGAIPTPSGQQWGRTPWSVKEGLRGFAEFAGGRPLEDIYAHMLQMQPQAPWGGRGRWRTPTQRD